MVFSGAVNPKDFQNLGQKKKEKEMNFDARFDGITVHMVHEELHVIYTQVSGTCIHLLYTLLHVYFLRTQEVKYDSKCVLVVFLVQVSQ